MTASVPAVHLHEDLQEALKEAADSLRARANALEHEAPEEARHLRDEAGALFPPTAFIAAFRDWISRGRIGHASFGRDSAGLPPGECLRHVHMVPLLDRQGRARWELDRRRGSICTSDRYLFYADGGRHGYLLIAMVVDPGAHLMWQPQNRDIVAAMTEIADGFCHFGKYDG